MYYNNQWATTGLYRRPLWRKIRDLFDSSYTSPINKKIIPSISGPATIGSFKLKQIELKEMNEPPENNNAKKRKSLEEKIYKDTKKYRPAESIEDYVFSDVNVPIPKVQINKKEFIIPITTPSVKIQRSKKTLILKIPKIKTNIAALKRLAYASTVTTMLILLTLGIFVSWRVIYLTDGDFLGATYLEKVNSFMQERLDPVDNRTQLLIERVNYLEAAEENRQYKDLIKYRPITKIYKLYGKNGKYVRTIIKRSN